MARLRRSCRTVRHRSRRSWLDTDGQLVIVNSVTTHQKVRNVRRDPRVAINAHDPAHGRVANIRGTVVEITVADAERHIDMLSQRYLGVDRYPYHHPDRPRIILKIQPRRIHTVGLD